ncbi:hypothetical protein BRC93_11975 [Halobacteriales archaeon QS_5_70_15]|nr:MAG: hypothetical protein BRC93_11975 [Halobacteriales archaeon QS_5_70_15]
MEKAPGGTPVGVDDPYAFVERCDHLTDDGRCRYAAEYAGDDPAFAAERRADDLRCPAADPHGDWAWKDCPHFRARQRDRECVRCGLEERRVADSNERPLLEEHHLSYRDDHAGAGEGSTEEGETDERGTDPAHEITVYLCRWCHAKVHGSWARVDDDASPDPEAVAAAEGRRSRELEETAFPTAAERYDDGGDGG